MSDRAPCTNRLFCKKPNVVDLMGQSPRPKVSHASSANLDGCRFFASTSACWRASLNDWLRNSLQLSSDVPSSSFRCVTAWFRGVWNQCLTVGNRLSLSIRSSGCSNAAAQTNMRNFCRSTYFNTASLSECRCR